MEDGPDGSTKRTVDQILLRLNEELQKAQKRITLLEEGKSEDENKSEACIIMIMQLEVAFLLVNKLFEAGLFKNLKFDKKDFPNDTKG